MPCIEDLEKVNQIHGHLFYELLGVLVEVALGDLFVNLTVKYTRVFQSGALCGDLLFKDLKNDFSAVLTESVGEVTSVSLRMLNKSSRSIQS